MRQRIVLGLLALTLLGVDSAHADGARRDRALAVAEITWGGPPPCSPVWVTRAYLGDNVLAHAERGLCRVTFNRTYYPLEWPMYCSIMVHELGHLHGLGHSSDPRNVMYPSLERVYWRCRRTR